MIAAYLIASLIVQLLLQDWFLAQEFWRVDKLLEDG